MGRKVSEGGGGGIAAAMEKQQNDTRLRIQARSAEATQAERDECQRILKKAKDALKKESEEVTMTPALAALIFTNAKMHNRDWHAAKSLKLAKAMNDGEFKDNGDTVRFFMGGNFADAQHRTGGLALTSAELAEKLSFQWTFVYGIPLDALPTIDTDRNARAAADTLKLEGVANAKQKEAALKSGASYLHKAGSLDIPHATNTQIIESCRAHDATLTLAVDIAEASEQGISQPVLKRTQAATIAFVCIISGWPEAMLRKFLHRVQSGLAPEGVSDKDPLFLASDIINTMREKARGKEKLQSQGEVALALQGMLLAAQGTVSTTPQKLKAAIKAMPDPSFAPEQAEAA